MLFLLLGTQSLAWLNDYYENKANATEVEYREAHLEAVQARKTHLKLKEYKDTVKSLKGEKQRLERQLEELKAAKAKQNAPIGAKPVYASSGSIWDELAFCESGGRWDYNGPSGFDGGIQFLPSTWDAMNTGYDYAWQAPREVQIQAGKKLQAQAGWGQWPACAAKLGLL